MKTETLKKLDDNKIVPQTLLLELPKEKEIPEEAISIREKYSKYGINNTTKRFVENNINQIKSDSLENKQRINTENTKNTFLNLLVHGMIGYKVVTYKTLNDVCTDHKLVIHGLFAYDRVIPDEVITSLDIFTERLSKNEDLFVDRCAFQYNKFPTYTNEYGYRLREMPFDSLFKIAAPKSHFNKDEYNHQIGNELVNIEKPKITEKINWNGKLPEAKDPIIFVPFLFLNKIYCIIVDAWDKEGDDTRIRNMF